MDLPPPLQGPLCGACLRALRPWEGTIEATPSLLGVQAAFAYKRPLSQLLFAFKYRGRLQAGGALAAWMAGTYRQKPELHGADCVVPVPLHPRRLRERGFNQAEILAESVARAAGAPLRRDLRRVRNTAPQWRLNRVQRAENLRGAFEAPAPLPYARALLVDDVYTSGGTLEDCARALKAAGVSAVKAYVLARD